MFMIEYENKSKNYDYSTTETTRMDNDEVISTLNELIETCKDGHEGFKQSAEGVSDSQLKSLLYEFSQQRSQFVGELQTLVRELGGDPEKSGSISGTLHRSWIDIKSVVTGQDEGAILNEAERGEDYAKNAYLKALESNLPSNVRAIVSQQFEAIRIAHDQVKALRDSAIRTAKSANNY